MELAQLAEERVASPARREPLSPGVRRMSKWMFLGHLWLGVLTTAVVILLSVSGILLNHKRALGLMPDVPHEPSGEFSSALPMAELVRLAGLATPEAAGDGVDRLDVRPRNGLMKVRYRDRLVTEVTLDVVTGEVLHVGERNDVFLEKLHTGEIFGDPWVLLSDFAAVVLILLIVTGYWLWLFPRSRM